uniref:Uncharacterized protein n=1 Tax=Arundo donax TaxID=35708 RepID=A0A0A9D3R2_ARUDO
MPVAANDLSSSVTSISNGGGGKGFGGDNLNRWVSFLRACAAGQAPPPPRWESADRLPLHQVSAAAKRPWTRSRANNSGVRCRRCAATPPIWFQL